MKQLVASDVFERHANRQSWYCFRLTSRRLSAVRVPCPPCSRHTRALCQWNGAQVVTALELREGEFLGTATWTRDLFCGFMFTTTESNNCECSNPPEDHFIKSNPWRFVSACGLSFWCSDCSIAFHHTWCYMGTTWSNSASCTSYIN